MTPIKQDAPLIIVVIIYGAYHTPPQRSDLFIIRTRKPHPFG